MVAVKKLAAVTAVLFLTLSIIVGVTAWSTVHAAESSEAVLPFTQFEMANTTENPDAKDTESDAASDSSDVPLTQEEIPMAEAKVSILETKTEEKGMSSLLGFAVVVAAAGVTGIAVAVRARLGRKKRCYVPADDLTLLGHKK